MKAKDIFFGTALVSVLCYFLLSPLVSTEVRPNGVVVQPTEFLIPLYYFFLILGLLTFLGYFIISFKQKKTQLIRK